MDGKQNALIIILLQITILLSVHQITFAKEQVTLESTFCSKNEDVRTTSIHHDNINSLLNTLITQSSKSMFFETSYGNDTNCVNGHYVCRPDITLDTCNSCVHGAVKIFKHNCPVSKKAIAWYHECVVRYSDLTISATLEIEPSNTYLSTLDVTQPDLFPAIRTRTLEGIIREASMPDNKIRFAYNNTGLTLFGMAWCIPDIKPDDCKTCLTTTLTKIPDDGLAQWGSVLLTSCVLKYDTVPFIFSSKSRSLLAPSKG